VLERRDRAITRLVAAVQDLSAALTLEEIQAVTRRAARELTGADGATFVLRDGDLCYYADEDAIAPLWKGQRFPMSACISGWTMLNRRPAVIEDIYADPRVPADAYRPTFVKSLAMVPIRARDPVGAIGNYWARTHLPTEEEVTLLQALADATSTAIESVRIHADLEERVRRRTAQLEEANRDLQSFSYSVSHDLQAPLRAISGHARAIREESAERLDGEGVRRLERMEAGCRRMSELINDLMALATVVRRDLRRETVDASALARGVADALERAHPGRRVSFSAPERLTADADAGLLAVVLDNLLSNAWKYTAGRDPAHVEFGAALVDGREAFFVRDDGAGFDSASARGLFEPFHRFHSDKDFPGTGIGLAIVARVIRRHGGSIWARSEPGRGAVFYFTLS
jgi:signal transduction histidine kinase